MQCEKCRGTDIQLAGSGQYFCRRCGLTSTQIKHELAQTQIGLSRNLPSMIGGGVAQRVMQAAAQRQAQVTAQPQPVRAAPEQPTRYRKP